MPKQGIELEAKNLYVCRKDRLILQDASFKVQPATLTAIIGPNGAGKSSTFNVFTFDTSRSSGEVQI